MKDPAQHYPGFDTNLLSQARKRLYPFGFTYSGPALRGALFVHKEKHLALLLDHLICDRRFKFSYTEYTREQNQLMHLYQGLFRFITDDMNELEQAAEMLGRLLEQDFSEEGIKVSGFSGWRYYRLAPRTIVFADSNTYFIRYRKKITDQFKGESGNTSPATSTTNWKVQNVTLGKVTEGENVYAGERIAFNHGGLWTEGHVLSNTAPVDNVATFTVDAAATIEEKDIFETILPWKGLLDEEIQVVAAFILLTKEGHRRGQDGLAALYAEAMDQVEDLAGDIGKSQKGVRIEW